MILYIVVLFCNLISFRYLLKKINFFRIAISWLTMQFMLCKPKHLCIEKKNHTYHSLHHTSSILHMARKYKFDIFKTKFRNCMGVRYLKAMHGTVRKIKSKVTMTTTYLQSSMMCKSSRKHFSKLQLHLRIQVHSFVHHIWILQICSKIGYWLLWNDFNKLVFEKNNFHF